MPRESANQGFPGDICVEVGVTQGSYQGEPAWLELDSTPEEAEVFPNGRTLQCADFSSNLRLCDLFPRSLPLSHLLSPSLYSLRTLQQQLSITDDLVQDVASIGILRWIRGVNPRFE